MMRNYIHYEKLYPLINQEKNLPHFNADSTKYGYTSLKEAIEGNKKIIKENFFNVEID